MNTCLSNVYLKFSRIDPRYVRLVLFVLTLVASRGVIMHLPISGDVSG